MSRERLFAILGLALGAAIGIAAALALGGCKLDLPRTFDDHVRDTTRTAFNSLNAAGGQ